ELILGDALVVPVLVGLQDLLREATSGGDLNALRACPLADLAGLAVGSPLRVRRHTHTARTVQPLLHVLAEVLSVIVREVDLVVTPLEGVLDGDVSLATVDIVNQLDDGLACHYR